MILLSLAPVLLVSQLNVPVAASRYALADRWALPAIAAGAVLLALIGASLARRPVSIGAGLITAIWVAGTLALSGRTHAAYRDTETLAAFQDARYQATPERLRALEDRCDYLERRMHQALRERDPARALAQAGAPPPGCPHPARFTLLRLVALTQLRRFSEASAEAARLEGKQLEPRYHGQAAYHAGLAHAETGDLDRAETELRQASRLGYRSCNLLTQLGRLLARRNQLQPAAQEYERAAACSPGDPRPLLAAASLWAAARDPSRARELLGRINPAGLPPELRATYDTVNLQVEREGP
jgi:tetratricopeptide (TPR) repeat protein